MFVEELDIILAASEDSNIYVWGFDDSAVAVLQGMKQSSEQEENRASEMSSLEKYAILLKGGTSGSVLTGGGTFEQERSSTMRLQKVTK